MANTLLDSQIFKAAFSIMGETWFLWLPPLLLFMFWETWVSYVRAASIAKGKWILLEVKVPREVAKSPKAMESILAGIHGTGRLGNLHERYWQGWLSPWFSFEIVGDSTGVHFYVWTLAFFKRMVESQIYAQYPSSEIKEVPDYTENMPAALPNQDWNLWGTEFVLTKPDAYPIRTYEDFTLEDLGTKEEERKVDPLSALIEFLGALKGSERIWIQILVRPAGDKWKKEGEALAAKLLGKKVKITPSILSSIVHGFNSLVLGIFGASAQAPAKKDSLPSMALYMSPGEVNIVKAIEQNITKIGFETGIRWIYLANRAEYNIIAVPAMFGIFKQFSSQSLNGFKPNKRITTSADYILKTRREQIKKSRLYKAFRLRSFFYPPYRGRSHAFVLSSSELATVYHFPGMVVGAPSMERIEAKRGAPPPNLPV